MDSSRVTRFCVVGFNKMLTLLPPRDFLFLSRERSSQAQHALYCTKRPMTPVVNRGSDSEKEVEFVVGLFVRCG